MIFCLSSHALLPHLSGVRAFDRTNGELLSIRALFASGVLLLAAVLCMGAPAQGAPLSLPTPAPLANIPKELEGWQGWVWDRVPERRCPLVGEARQCVWIGKLLLSVTQNGASFTELLTVYRRSQVALPGGRVSFPIHVEATELARGSSFTPTMSIRDELPVLWLEPGEYRVTGEFRWDEMPEYLPIPEEIATLAVSRDGTPVRHPERTDAGELYLRAHAEENQSSIEDSLHIDVVRKLSDGIPFEVQTNVRLRVAGKAREIALGKVLLQDTVLVSAETELPIRFTSEGACIVQARPGTFNVTLTSLLPKPPASLQPPAIGNPDWPAEEIWLWQPNDDFRSVTLSGGTAVDPNRVEIPEGWTGSQVLLVTVQSTVGLEESARGEQSTGTTSLNVSRTMWLDFDGGAFSVRDLVSGSLRDSWRLNSKSSFELGQLHVGGEPQLISVDPETNAKGVELRSQLLNLVADARVHGNSLPATGWDKVVDNLSITVNLPPGWSLFHGTGADRFDGSWVSSWHLIETFFTLLIILATARLFGVPLAVLTGVWLVLSHLEVGAFSGLWVHLLIATALQSHLPSGGAKEFSLFYLRATVVVLGLFVIWFTYRQVLGAIYPGLVPPSQYSAFPLFYIIGAAPWAWPVFLLGLWGVVILFTGRVLRGIAFMVGAWLCTIPLFMLDSAVQIPMTRSTSEFNEAAYQSATTLAEPQAPGSEGGFSSVADDAEMAEDKLSAPAPLRQEMMKAGGAAKERRKVVRLDRADPNQVIQTGPGLPTWSWRSYRIYFDGPVSPDQELTLRLITPAENAFLSFVRVALLLALGAIFFRRAGSKLRPKAAPATMAAATLVSYVLFVATTPAGAQTLPSPELLQELENRLTREQCLSGCSSIGESRLEVVEHRAVFTATVSSRGVNGIPLPGPTEQFQIDEVKVDGETTSRIRRDDDGRVWVALPEGTHTVVAQGELARDESVALQFALPPFHLQVSAPEWSVDGLDERGYVAESLYLTRAASDLRNEEQSATEEKLTLYPWFTVRREFTIGVPWSIMTTVERRGGQDGPEVLRLPLIDGEGIVSDEVKIEDKTVVVQFPRGETTVSWASSFSERERIILAATEQPRVTESWRVVCTAVWQCLPELTPPFLAPSKTGENESFALFWHPYPKEQAAIRIRRPAGAAGQSVTVDNVSYTVTPGQKIVTGSVDLLVRASQGSTYSVQLPSGSTLKSLMVRGRDDTKRYNGNSLQIALEPGSSAIALVFELDQELSAKSAMPPLVLGTNSVNVSYRYALPQSRWLLWTSGPSWGARVLFWGKLVCLLIIAVVLGRWKRTPLGVVDWLLFTLGFAVLPIFVFVLPVVWLHAMALRRERPAASPRIFNLTQLLLGLLSLLALSAILFAIRNGLLVGPDMAVSGGASNGYWLSWYVDRAAPALETPWVFSLPRWCWSVFIVLWSSWTVFKFLQWISWAFACFTTDGIWKSRTKGEKLDTAVS